jgi:hypothetical protein
MLLARTWVTQLVKLYGNVRENGDVRYSAAVCLGARKTVELYHYRAWHSKRLRKTQLFFLFDSFVLFVYIVRMKRKLSQKRMAKQGSPMAEAPSEGVVKPAGDAPEVRGKPEAVNVSTECGPPPPDVVFADAEREPNRRQLREYSDSIRLLREKGLSFREIAEWFQDYGIAADHNAVYRVYLSTVHPADVAQLEQELQEEEMEDQV